MFLSAAADALRLPLSGDGGEGLRRAQVAAAHSIAAHSWASSRPALVVMPTGSGKTAVIILASILLRAKRVLVVAPSRLLREQLAEKFTTLDVLRKAGALDESIGTPRVVENRRRISDATQWAAFEEADVVVTTPYAASPGIEGVVAPPPDLFDVVVFDEAHHRPALTYDAIAKAFPGARNVLFTATPFRRDEREIPGDIVFTYTVKQARQDGIFGKLRFVPVEVASDQRADADRAIAKAATAQLSADRANGFRHAILVRAVGIDRADELAGVYAGTTSLKLQRLHSRLSQRSVRKTIEALRNGDLDGVIAVDMLGEGFDLPSLKVAALHAPHRSLAITLQFIGRFARTSRDTGEATFFAVLKEIEGEAASIYVPGAEWNEIVEDVSRDQIAAEADARRFVKTFVPQVASEDDDEGEDVASDEEDNGEAWALLRTVRPYFHAKVYEALGDVNLDAPLRTPRGVAPVLVRRSEEHHAIVWIGRQDTPVLWSAHQPWSDVSYEMFIVVHVPEHNFLFICASRRDNAVYDALVESVLGNTYRRLAPNEINRVLRDVEAPEFFSVGMRNRAGMGGGGAESYRMYAGRAADRAIRAGDAGIYDQGHGFCRGREGDDAVTIGFSSGSKVWANRRGPLSEFFEWLRAIAEKLALKDRVATGSGMDRLRAAERATTISAPVVFASLPDEAYAREDALVRFGRDEAWLVDMQLDITNQSAMSVELLLRGGNINFPFNVKLGRAPLFYASNHAFASTTVTDSNGRHEVPLIDYLNEHPVVLFLADLSTLRGDQLHCAPERNAELPITSQIDAHDWFRADVDPFTEKPPAPPGKRSLFEYVQDELIASGAAVVFMDDRANEIADLVAMRDDVDRVLVQLFHCKAASVGKKRRLPNQRIDDLYEVVGQAVKCRRWLDARRLARRIEDRSAKSSVLHRGTLVDVRSLLSTPARLAFEVVIVQPALSTRPKETIEHLLTAADAYMRGGDLLPLRMWGTSGSK